MTKTLNLKISERVAALKLFDEFEGNKLTLKALLDDVKAVSVKKEEWDAAKLVKKPDGNGNETWNWDDEIGAVDITLQEESAQYLKSEIKKKSEANKLTIANAPLISLLDKLEV